MSTFVPPQVPPNLTQMTKTVAEVADSLNNARHFGGVWGNWSSGKKQKRAEAYLDGSRTLFEQCSSLMEPMDKSDVVARYNA